MRTMIITRLIAALCLCAGTAIAAPPTASGTTATTSGQHLAQNGESPPTVPSGNGNTVPQQPPLSGSNPAHGSLSHQLSRSGGVIHPPPSADRGVVTPPNQGTSRTPVIPPPGTPGGNPMVQPK
jgi:hypothetical protein